MTDAVRATMRDVRAAQMCSRGAREFFMERGWDWDDFLNNGIPVETLYETGDAMAIRVAEVACGRK